MSYRGIIGICITCIGAEGLSQIGLTPRPSNSFAALACHCQTYQVGDGLVRGKVNREILETIFGEALMTSIAADNNQQAVDNLLCSDSDVGDEKEGRDEDDGDLTGTDQTARKLQVTANSSLMDRAYLSMLLSMSGYECATCLQAVDGE